MAENLSEDLSTVKKKVRRGQRGSKKSGGNSIEEFLNVAVQELEVQPKKRPPRKPKIPEQEVRDVDDEPGRLNEQTNSVSSNWRAAPKAQKDPAKNTAGDSALKRQENAASGLSSTNWRQKSDSIDWRDIEKRIENLDILLPSQNASNGARGKNRVPQTRNHNHEQKKFDKNKFRDHMPEKIIRKLLSEQNTACPEYVEGNIRINPKFFKEAYVGMANDEADLLIDGIADRNRALEGDLVVVRINPKDKWRSPKSARPQKTAIVVCIVEKVHSRKVVGFLKTMPDNNAQVALFSPKDHRVPRLNIDAGSWPPNFFNDPQSYANTLFLAEITAWTDVRFARGKIIDQIGQAGDLKAESNAILLENDLDVTPYGTELTKGLPPSDYQPTEKDIDGREDWRKECVFTIDPSTATDLDDAMSCKPLENGNFEVGVHISDVTHYLEADCALDKAVSKRATTIYMSDSVYHMLPKQLCNVCSLLPGQDKLAFSIIFELNCTGEVVKHRFAKTVINSCCQFAYDHAQAMIENPDKEWSLDEMPKIHGGYKVSELSAIVNNLNNLAVKMRENRLNRGSLRIDQAKLHVLVDRESGLPVSFTLEEQKESNRLIEEFMLLANITAATHLFENLPNVALLRCHQPPLMRLLKETQTTLEKLGIHIDIESAGALQASLLRYQPDSCNSSEKDVYLASCRSKVLNALCSKPMTRARYFCTSANMGDENLRHYALNVPLYTHFTSPIRRYSDCVVHRLLYASLKNALPVPNWNPKLCAKISANCNKQKFNSKRAQEMSSELFLTAFLGMMGPLDSTSIAIDVKDRSVDVIVCSIGITLRIYFAEIEKVASVQHEKNDDIQTVTIVWKKSKVTQVINIFSIMNVSVSKHPETNRLHAKLLEPEEINF